MEEKEAKEIYEHYWTVQKLQKGQGGLDLALAEELAYLKEKDRYKAILGYPEGSWKSFIAQPELQPLKVGKADRLVKIYQTYIKDLGLKSEDILGIDSNSLYRIATIVNSKNVRGWLSKARNLSRGDLHREVKYGHVDEVQCKHDMNVKVIETCKICGMKQTRKA
jgi:hypothetical protein